MAHKLEEQINALVDTYLEDYAQGKDIDKVDSFDHPDKETIVDILNKLQRIVFPGFFKNRTFKVYTVRNDISMQLEDILFHLIRQLEVVLPYGEAFTELSGEALTDKAEDLAFAFLNSIPKVRAYIETDVQAAFDGDPAAFYKDEIIYTYPGLFVIRLLRERYLRYHLTLGIRDRQHIVIEAGNGNAAVFINHL